MKKAEIELVYVEILNTTEQLLIFSRLFNKKEYGLDLTLNIALPIEVQDIQIRKIVERLETMKIKDANEATKVPKVQN